MPELPQLARRDGVELARVGTWSLGTGMWDATSEDFAAAIAATACPAVRRPYIRIGHTDQRFKGEDGDPAVGWIENLRLADGGHTLVGDYVGVPAWLNSIMASAYPDRSVEGAYNRTCQLGHRHPFVLDGLALLGITRPGVGVLKSLDDVRDLYDLAASDAPDAEEMLISASIPGKVFAAAVEHTGAMVALIPTAADAERLAVDGGEPAEELHVTLAYLGDAADLDAGARQRIIASVSSTIAGMPIVEADGFALAAFNPASDERETCLVLSLSGADVDMAHTAIGYALDGDLLVEQHRPWHAHLSLTYTDDLNLLPKLVDRTGPVVFDRVRIAFAGEHVDIPLIPAPDPADVYADEPELVAASADDNKLKDYWTKGAGLKRWKSSAHPWTTLYGLLKKHLGSERAKRVASQWYHDVLGRWPGSRKGDVKATEHEETTMPNPQPSTTEMVKAAWNASQPPDTWIVRHEGDAAVIVMHEPDRTFRRVPVVVDGDQVTFGEPQPVVPGYVAPELVAASVEYATREESRPDANGPPPPVVPAPNLPAAEPEPNTPEPKEDHVSDWSELSSRLGLDENADKDAILSAVDALKTKADAPTQPSPELVAAAAAEKDEMKAEITRLSGELAKINASAAADAKRVLFDGAVRDGKLKPADREGWEARYDRAPDVITEILASTAPNSAVPVAASGYTGQAETGGTDMDVPDDIAALFSTPFSKEA
jgi:2'-5' RNA ligase